MPGDATPDSPFRSIADIARVAPHLATAMESVYAWRRCNAVAWALHCATMRPVMILDCDDDFGHAALVVDRSAPSPNDWLVADIMGVRRVEEVRAIYEDKMGRLRLSFHDEAEDGGCGPLIDEEPDEAVLLLAGRCPWLRDLVREEYRQPDDRLIIPELERIMGAIQADLRNRDPATRRVSWKRTWALTEEMLYPDDAPAAEQDDAASPGGPR